MKKKYKEFKSGIYRPQNIKKFNNDVRLQYRSKFELNFLRWCDMNPNVENISYEKIIIPYICKTDNKLHRYYIDFKITIKGEEYLIEIKPYNKTIPPKESKRKKRTTILYEKLEWVKNNSKWDSAKQYCKQKKYKWVILTEKGIYIDGVFNDDIKLQLNK